LPFHPLKRMYFQTHSSYGYQRNSASTSTWDPVTVLELIHPMRGEIRCVGYAPSKRRRCMNPTASSHFGQSSLRQLAAREDAYEASKSPILKDAAREMLCYLHCNQASKIAETWSDMLLNWASQHPKTKPYKTESHFSDVDIKSESHDESEAEDSDIEELQRKFTEMQHQFARLQAEMKRREAQQKKRENERREKERHDQERRAEEERSFNERKERERQEQAKREQDEREAAKRERKRREEEEREQKRREEETKRKEGQEREERIRERARLARERREREAREKVEKEAKEWSDAWTRYSKSWEEIKKSEKVSYSNLGILKTVCLHVVVSRESDPLAGEVWTSKRRERSEHQAFLYKGSARSNG